MGERTYLDDIGARCEAATSGPWTRHLAEDGERMPDGSGGRDGSYETGDIETVGEEPQDICFSAQAADATFIAHAREDVPALLAIVREARRLLVIAARGYNDAGDDINPSDYVNMALDAIDNPKPARARSDGT